MEIGWIDFSKTERDKINSILDLLTDPGTLDEMGIAQVRDGFSNLFFPRHNNHPDKSQIFFNCTIYPKGFGAEFYKRLFKIKKGIR